MMTVVEKLSKEERNALLSLACATRDKKEAEAREKSCKATVTKLFPNGVKGTFSHMGQNVTVKTTVSTSTTTVKGAECLKVLMEVTGKTKEELMKEYPQMFSERRGSTSVSCDLK